MNRRNFLKLGALFVPIVAAPTVAYSFLWAPTLERETGFENFQEVYDAIMRELAISLQIPEHILRGRPAVDPIVRTSSRVICGELDNYKALLSGSHQ